VAKLLLNKEIKPMKLSKLSLLLLSSLFANSAASIVIRHDVNDEKYNATIEDFTPLATLYAIGVHGTLIDPNWVLTAGHAIFCMEPGDKIKVGYHWAEIEQRYTHVDYELGEENDIALLKLKQPITAIKPAKIYRNSDEETQDIWFIGSGGTGNGNEGQTVSYSQNNGKLRKAQNTINGTSEREIYFTFNKGDKALPLEGVSGNADSGGPAYKFIDDIPYVYGISSRNDSFFKDVGEYGVKEVYTRVSYHAVWIDKIMENDRQYIDKYTTQERFAQDNIKDQLSKACEVVGYK